MSVNESGEQRQDDGKDACVEKLGDSAFKISFHVPRSLCRRLLGENATRKKVIEAESRTSITIPGEKKSANSQISITGKSKEDVCLARVKIELMVDGERKKARPTHFTCVPACTNDMKDVFNQIKESILSYGYPGVDESLFIRDSKLHITFGVCTLFDDHDRKKAAEVFKKCCQEFIDRKLPIEVNVRGLHKFDDEKSTAVKVIFAGIHSEKLQELANKVLVAFREAKLNTKNLNDVAKLHMTVLKIAYGLMAGSKRRRTFDATNILKKYSDYYFGTFLVDMIHLSQIGSQDENGFYKALCTVNF